MELEDLQTGWLIEIRGNAETMYSQKIFRVMLNCKCGKFSINEDLLIGEEGVITLSSFNEDLTHTGGSYYDIVRVFEPFDSKGLISMSPEHSNMIWWEDKDKRKVTMEQLEELVGEPFVIIE